MHLPYSNLQIRHQNPEASKPLILPLTVVCNTSDEQIYGNIKTNSARPLRWQKLEKAHDRIAVICGSGPSLQDSIQELRAWKMRGAVIFALNGAASFLNDNGILADWQVMIDARPETAELVGPAKGHLFGSQVHPDTFAKIVDPKIWHLQVGDIENYFPKMRRDQGGYALIGGAASVGNCTTCLAYVMGFREVHCYGYDSCHRNGHGHAFAQPLNDGEPCCSVRFNGKDYHTSLTMRLQAEKFMETSAALKQHGVKLFVHGSGLLPDIYNAPPLSEHEKYQLMWADPDYSTVAPGEACVEEFLTFCRPIGRVIDFGCGTGRAGLLIHRPPERLVTLVDFVVNSRGVDALDLPFLQADLSKPIPIEGDWGFCTDVMEHIPSADVATVITNIMATVPCCFFQISFVPDAFGATIGHPLHLTVRSYEWWGNLFARLGYFQLLHRDDGDSGVFVIAVKGN